MTGTAESFQLTKGKESLYVIRNSSKTFDVGDNDNIILLEITNEHLFGLFDPLVLFDLIFWLRKLTFDTTFFLKIFKNQVVVFDVNDIGSFKFQILFDKLDTLFKTKQFTIQCVNGNTYGETGDC